MPLIYSVCRRPGSHLPPVTHLCIQTLLGSMSGDNEITYLRPGHKGVWERWGCVIFLFVCFSDFPLNEDQVKQVLVSPTTNPCHSTNLGSTTWNQALPQEIKWRLSSFEHLWWLPLNPVVYKWEKVLKALEVGKFTIKTPIDLVSRPTSHFRDSASCCALTWWRRQVAHL